MIDSRGYIVTNYHVIERAYEIQQQQQNIQSFYKNITSSLPTCPLFHNNNTTNSATVNRFTLATAQVYVRIDSPTKYQLCRIVAVHPEIDVAIVQVVCNKASEDKKKTTFQSSLQFGRSSQLLVGQTVIAIGNPFGYDTTVTTAGHTRKITLLESFKCLAGLVLQRNGTTVQD